MAKLFYEKAKPLDALKEEKHPTKKQIKEVIESLQNESLRRYFFYKLNNPAWVVPLKEEGVFLLPPRPIKLGEDLIRYPVWDEAEYLARVAQYCPNEVVAIIKKLSSTESVSAQTNLVDAVLKIPATYSTKTIPILIKWLKQGYHFYLYHRAGELVIELTRENQWKGARKLFFVLLELSEREYEIQETLKELVEHAEGIQTFKILELLEECIDKIIIAPKQDEHSYIWRPSIEDHQQNIASHSTRDLVISSARDMLKKCVKVDISKTKSKIKKYLKSKHKIYWRLALNTITQFPDKFIDLVFPVLKDGKYLYESGVHYEYFELLKEAFRLLTKYQQAQLVELIRRGPEKGIDEGYKQRWIRNRLWMIKERLDKETKKELDKIVDSYEKPEHPEFFSYSRSWVGPESPRTKEELEKLSVDELIKFLLEWEPEEEHFAPSPEGLGRELETLVSENPSEYVNKAESFLDNKMRPVYCFYFLQGLRSAVAKKKTFPWEPVLSFCEKIIVKQDKDAQEKEEGERVSYDNVRYAVADLLQDAVSGKDSPLPIELMSHARDILLSPTLINNPQPTVEYEAEHDPVNLSINTVRGIAMHALIHYAWKRVWLIDKAKEKNETDRLAILNVQAGRLEENVKKALNEKLDRDLEKTLTIHSIYGRYFPLLHYIDKEWAAKSARKIFPASANENKCWEIAWKAYLLFNPLYHDMYGVLKEQYVRTVKELSTAEGKKSDDELTRQLAGHFMAVYLRKLESLEDSTSLLNRFLAEASDKLRSSCVWILKSVLEEEKVEKQSDNWRKLKQYWENRLAVAETAKNPADYRQEIGAFTFWLTNVPEELPDIFELVKTTTNYVNDSTDIHHLLDYLDCQRETYSLECGKILDALVNEATEMNLRHNSNVIRKILTDCIHWGGEANTVAIELINRLGELGIFEFKDLLESQPT